jgi:hypothetical protein
MEITSDKKSQILLDLLQDLMGEMKSGAGNKLKPKMPEVKGPQTEVDEASHEPGEDEEAEEAVLPGGKDEDDAPRALTGASARLAKRLGK